MLRAAARLGWGLAALVLSAGPARAYIDPADVILERAAARRARLGFSTVVLEGRLVEAAPSSGHPALALGPSPDGEGPVAVWTALAADQAIRTEVRHPDRTEVTLLRGRDRFDFVVGRGASVPERRAAAPFLELLGSREPDPRGRRGLALLARMGIDATVVRLALHAGRPTYVIGAEPSDIGTPQLRVDKELLTPVLWRDAEGREVRLSGYHLPTTGPWFPERVERLVGGRTERVVIYERARLNVPIVEGTFAPPR